jgi:hypothetical protein
LNFQAFDELSTKVSMSLIEFIPMNEGQLLFPSSTFATDGNDKVLSTN